MKGTGSPRDTKDFKSFSAGQQIFREGQPGDVMYIVVEGNVDILVGDKIVETVGPGGILGEMALIDNKARSATAIAKTDCKLMPINKTHFVFLVQETPYFALQVMKTMTDRLRYMNTKL
jgi:CRP-like cAMP-binding protein